MRVRPVLLLALSMTTAGGCTGTLVLSDDDDTAMPDDDDTTGIPSDDDTTGIPADDDDVADDDAIDMSTFEGTRVVSLDFSDWAEDSWGLTDCTAPYALHGPAVTDEVHDLCAVCDHIYQLVHEPDPADAVEACVSQAYWETTTFERLYGLQMTSETEFVLWRSVGQVDAELREYGTGTLAESSLWFESDTEDHEWYSYWTEGEGTFGP